MNNTIDSNAEIMDVLLISDNSYRFSDICRDYEILYVLSGYVQMNIGDINRKIDSGNIIAVNPREKRAYNFSEHALAVMFRISSIRLWKLAIGHPILVSCDTQSNPSKSYERLKSLMRKAISCQLGGGISDKLKKYSYYYEILQEIIENHSNYNSTLDTGNLTESDLRKLAVLEYIHANYSRQFSLQELAKSCNLSLSYMSKFIKNSIGVGFLELLNETRLHYAVDDLIKTDMPISKIAFENGFPNFASFNRVFKDTYRVTPTEYRKQNSVVVYKDTAAINQKNQKKLRNFFSGPLDQDNQKSNPVFYADSGSAMPFSKNWNKVFSLGPAYYLLNSDVQEHVKYLKKEYGFKYLHISGIFSKELLIDLHSTKGYNFSKLDRIFDFLVENEIIPFADIGFQPWGMIGSSSTEIVYEDYELSSLGVQQYENLIKGFLSQCIQRYGEDELSKWYFDLFRHSSLPIQNSLNPGRSYLSFLKAAYACIKKQIPQAKIGGCGTYTYDLSDFTDMVFACAEAGLTPDFFSVQIYPYIMARYNPDDSGKSSLAQTGQHFEVSEDQDYIIRKIQRLRDILAENGFSSDSLVAVGWNMSLSCRNFLNDSCYRGAYIVRTLISCSEVSNPISHLGITDLLYEHFSPTLQLFGGFGLISKDGIRKPAYYAFEFMNRLGDLLVSKGSNYIITKDSRGRFFIVCHNCGNLSSDYYGKFHDEADYKDVASLTAQEPLDFILKISGLTSQRYLTKKYSVGENSGSVLDEWMRLGYIESVGWDEIDYLSSISVPRQQSEAIKIQNDTLSVSIHLAANEIQLIQVLPMQE